MFSTLPLHDSILILDDTSLPKQNETLTMVKPPWDAWLNTAFLVNYLNTTTPLLLHYFLCQDVATEYW